MRTREEIYKHEVLAVEDVRFNNDGKLVCQNTLLLEVLIDIREILQEQLAMEK